MAENVEILDIDLSQLNEETQQTTKTLKDLREEVKALREQLNNTTIGTEEFEKTLGQLEDKQKELANVTKSTNKAMEGSYNDLAQQMSALKNEWKATADVTERAELGQKIMDLNTQLKAMDAEIGNFQRNVGNYGSALSNLGNTINQTSEFTNGITSSFGSALLVMNSMGVESNELTKILQKMQLVMSFTRGLKDLEKGTKLFTKLGNAIKGADIYQKIFSKDQKAGAVAAGQLATGETAVATSTTAASTAMKVFRTALISTGIGAFVVAVGALVNMFDKLSTATEDASDKWDKAMTSLERQFSYRDMLLEGYIRYAEAFGASAEEIYEMRRDELKKQKADVMEAIDNMKTEIETLQASATFFNSHKDEIEKLVEQYNELVTKARNLGDEITALDFNRNIDRAIEAHKDEQKATEEAIKTLQNAQKAWQDFLKTRITIQNKLNDLQEQAALAQASERDKELMEVELWYNAQLDELDENENKERAALKASYKSKAIDKKTYEANLLNITSAYATARGNVEILHEKKTAEAVANIKKKEAEDAKKAQEDKIKALRASYKAEIDLIDAQNSALMTHYALIGDKVNLSKTNELFLATQLEKLNTLREALVALGDDVTDIDAQITDTLSAQAIAFTETMQAKADQLTELTDQMSDTISRITSIGDGLSSEWSNVFSAMSNGIENVTKQLKTGEKGWRSYGAMAVSALNVASSMMVALADEQDEESKEGFEQQKKYQIAAATMSMLGGIVEAWVSAMNPANAWMTIWGQLAAGTAMSAMIAAMGIMQINKIKQQKFGGSEAAAAGNVATPSMTALQSMNSGVDVTTSIQGASTEGQVTDTRVYVLESDIASTTQRVQVAQSEATF